MKIKNNIVVCGDIHGEFGQLNSFISHYSPNYILQCGDFGYYWTNDTEEKCSSTGKIKPHNTKIYWCDGNHENHETLNNIKNNHKNWPIEIEPNIFYCPRNTVIEINGKKILFIGGADSIDKHYRIYGISWWDTELIQYSDFENSPNVDVDVIISHTCPWFFQFSKNFKKYNDPSAKILELYFEKYKPKNWYFGHFHEHKVQIIDGCTFHAMNTIGRTEWWKPLNF